MRFLLTALLVSLPAAAQISGSLTATGGVHLTLDLQCELACSPVTYAASDIGWRYSALDGGAAFFAQTALDGGHFEVDGASPKLGTALTFTTSASCACGAIDSGVISVTSAPFPVAPAFELPETTTVEKGALLIVHGFPQGTETIELTCSGAGLDGGLIITHSGADFTGGNTTVVLHPTEPGVVTISATLEPWNVTANTTMTVARDTPKPDEQPKGCATVPGFAPWLLCAVLWSRRSK